MSSWRNLMTPLNEKYQPQESINSSLGQSKFTRTNSIKSTERESLRGSLYNEKMHSLQSEMSRLKNQLGRYSKKAVMNTESIYTPTESVAKQTFTNAADELEELEYNSQFQGTDYDKMAEQINTVENDNDYINLIPDYQYSEIRTDNIRDDDVDLDLEERENYGDYMNRPMRDERKRISFRNHSRRSSGGDESRIMNIKDRNGNIREIKEQIRQHESGRSRRSSIISNEPLRDVSNRGVMEDVLYNCQNEIGELKDVVIDSRKRIEALQEELDKEKIQTKRLRNEIQRTSVRQSRDENNVYSRCESPSMGESKFDGFRNSRSFHEDNEPKWASRNSEQKQSQKLMASKGSRNGSDYKIPPSNRGLSTGNKLRNAGVGAEKQMKTTGIQCDFMLENIVDTNDENEKEAMREEIDALREEVSNLKVIAKSRNIIKVIKIGTEE